MINFERYTKLIPHQQHSKHTLLFVPLLSIKHLFSLLTCFCSLAFKSHKLLIDTFDLIPYNAMFGGSLITALSWLHSSPITLSVIGCWSILVCFQLSVQSMMCSPSFLLPVPLSGQLGTIFQSVAVWLQSQGLKLGHIIFIKIYHEIICTVILPLLLIQEGQLSITSKSMCTSNGKPLRGLSLPRKKVDWLNIT